MIISTMVDKLTGRIAFRANPEMETAINEIAEKHRRKASDIARLLLERGLSMFLMDGQISVRQPLNFAELDTEQVKSEMGKNLILVEATEEDMKRMATMGIYPKIPESQNKEGKKA